MAKVWISNPSMGSLIDTLYQSKLYFSSLKNCLCTFHKCDETAHHKNDFPTRDMVKIEQMVMMRWVDENDNSREGGKGCDLIIGPDEKIEVQWGVFKLISV